MNARKNGDQKLFFLVIKNIFNREKALHLLNTSLIGTFFINE
jgi:hypothetical protein